VKIAPASSSAFNGTLRHLGATFDRIQRSNTALATGQRINRGSDDPAGLISSEQLSRVLAALEAEAYTLGRADAVASAADGHLAEASHLMRQNDALDIQLANTAALAPGVADALRSERSANLQAITRITSNAAFNDVPLFDGAFALSVGGGRLALPDLVSSVPTTSALSVLRGQVGAFQTNVIAGRLGVVQATIANTQNARSFIRDTDMAAQTAQLARDQVLAQAGTAVAAQNLQNLGSVLDLLA